MEFAYMLIIQPNILLDLSNMSNCELIILLVPTDIAEFTVPQGFKVLLYNIHNMNHITSRGYIKKKRGEV